MGYPTAEEMEEQILRVSKEVRQESAKYVMLSSIYAAEVCEVVAQETKVEWYQIQLRSVARLLRERAERALVGEHMDADDSEHKFANTNIESEG